MTAYCILVLDTKNKTANVSQEAYRSYEEAERFIKSRSDVREIPPADQHGSRRGIFHSKGSTKYIIKEIRVI